MSNLVLGLPALLQVNECLSTSMQICSFKVSRSESLLTAVHMTDQKTTESSKDPIAANSAVFSCSCMQYKTYREPKSFVTVATSPGGGGVGVQRFDQNP